jgi:hypothetical protein
MAQPRMRTAKPPRTRQNASYKMNSNNLSLIQIDEILATYPPPKWMDDKAKLLWANAINSYHPGQFKRYNLAMLEQWVLITRNIDKLTHRLGHMDGLIKPINIIEEDGTIETITKVTKEYLLYRSLVLLLSRVELSLHMAPRPYVMMASAESETLDAELRDDLEDNRTSYIPKNRNHLLGGRQTIN